MKCVIDLVDSVDSTKNFLVAPGCDMPFSTPIENTIAVAEAVHHVDKYRALLKDYEAVIEDVDVTTPDYANLERPLIEAFTLDSASCAACTAKRTSSVLSRTSTRLKTLTSSGATESISDRKSTSRS